MTTPLKSILLALAFSGLLAGCVGTPTALDFSQSHPANPHAAQSPLPPTEPMLMNTTNPVVVKPINERAPEHPHGHEDHETTTKREGEK